MLSLACSDGLDAEIVSAIRTLKALYPMSPVVRWWHREGQYAHYVLSADRLKTVPSYAITSGMCAKFWKALFR